MDLSSNQAFSDGRRFIVYSDNKLTAFLEPARVTHESSRFLNTELFGTILP